MQLQPLARETKAGSPQQQRRMSVDPDGSLPAFSSAFRLVGGGQTPANPRSRRQTRTRGAASLRVKRACLPAATRPRRARGLRAQLRVPAYDSGVRGTLSVGVRRGEKGDAARQGSVLPVTSLPATLLQARDDRCRLPRPLPPGELLGCFREQKGSRLQGFHAKPTPGLEPGTPSLRETGVTASLGPNRLSQPVLKGSSRGRCRLGPRST
jgi:hypothetical protein